MKFLTTMTQIPKDTHALAEKDINQCVLLENVRIYKNSEEEDLQLHLNMIKENRRIQKKKKTQKNLK